MVHSLSRAAVVPLLVLLALEGCSCEEGPIQKTTGRIELGQGVVDFNKVCLGDRVEVPLPVYNRGTVPLLLDSVEISGSSAFTVVSAPERLAAAGQAGSEDVILLAFEPAAPGKVSADLVIASSDAERPEISARLTGEGDDGVRVDLALLCENEDGSMLEACPAALLFGDVAVGATKELPVVLENRGCAELYLTEYSVQNTVNEGFSVTGPELPASPEDEPVVISQTTQQTLVLTLAPDTPDAFTGTLSLSYLDHRVTETPESRSVNLIGQGVELQLIVEPAGFIFSEADVNTPQTQTFTVRNIGGQAGTIEAIQLRDGSPEFSIDAQGLPTTLAGGQSYTFDVTYAPTDAGRDEDALVVVTNAGNLDPVPIAGGAVPQIEVDPPTTVDFGMVQTGGFATADVTVRNVGRADLNVTALDFKLNPAMVFSIEAAPSLPVTLAPTESFTATLRFDDNPSIGKDAQGMGQSELGELAIVSDDPSYADQGGEYLLVLATDTQANFGPTARLCIFADGMRKFVQPADVTVGQVVTFDAAGVNDSDPQCVSTDPENDPLTYTWTLRSAPMGATATLTSSSGQTTTLQPDFPGRWEVELQVEDPFGNQGTATSELSVTQP